MHFFEPKLRAQCSNNCPKFITSWIGLRNSPHKLNIMSSGFRNFIEIRYLMDMHALCKDICLHIILMDFNYNNINKKMASFEGASR